MKTIKNYFYIISSSAPKALVWISVAMFGMILTPLALAQNSVEPTNVITSANDVVTIFCAGLSWMFWLVLVLGIAMALVASYYYITSNGDAEKVSKATKTLTYVAIALVVALCAKGFPLLVGSFLGVNSGLSTCN